MWYQLRIEKCHQDEAELLSELLEEIGALAVTFTDKNDDPVLEPLPGSTPLWPEVSIEALFTEEDSANSAKDHLSSTYPNLNLSIHTLPNQDWERTWMEDFKPICFGKRLWICPSWLTPPDPDAVNLILDPGLAFGTGTHPTTHLCLQWLDEADLEHKTLIDYGCGSGILALAALKLGAPHVEAIDIDPQALEATQNNAIVNNLSERLTISFPEKFNETVDILIANILLEPLLSLQQDFHSFLKPHGIIVLSGILQSQVPSLITAYQECFTHKATQIMGDWALVTFMVKTNMTVM